MNNLSEKALEFLKKENSDYIELTGELLEKEKKETNPTQKYIDYFQDRLEMRNEIKDFLDSLNS